MRIKDEVSFVRAEIMNAWPALSSLEIYHMLVWCGKDVILISDMEEYVRVFNYETSSLMWFPKTCVEEA